MCRDEMDGWDGTGGAVWLPVSYADARKRASRMIYAWHSERASRMINAWHGSHEGSALCEGGWTH